MLFFFVLGSVCNAELRTWTAVNGKEVEAEFASNEKGIVKLKLKSGKVFEVPANKLSKEDNEFISSLAKPEGVNYNELEEREGIIYLKGSDTLYTGKVYELHENGQKKTQGYFKDGKEDGLRVSWYKNGQKEEEGNWKEGKPDGLMMQWYENGQKESEGNGKNGKADGLHIRWDKNGHKEYEATYKDGEKISEKSLDELAEEKRKGERDETLNKIISEAIDWENPGEDFQKESYTGWVKSKLFDGQVWWTRMLYQIKDGKSVLRITLYKNGKKKLEEKLKDGRDIAETSWYENGQKKSESAPLVDDKKHGLSTYWHENGQMRRKANYKDGKLISEKFWDSKGEPVDSMEEAINKNEPVDSEEEAEAE